MIHFVLALWIQRFAKIIIVGLIALIIVAVTVFSLAFYQAEDAQQINATIETLQPLQKQLIGCARESSCKNDWAKFFDKESKSLPSAMALAVSQSGEITVGFAHLNKISVDLQKARLQLIPKIGSQALFAAPSDFPFDKVEWFCQFIDRPDLQQMIPLQCANSPQRRIKPNNLR